MPRLTNNLVGRLSRNVSLVKTSKRNIERNCKYCGLKFFTSRKVLKSGSGIFCNIECQHENQRKTKITTNCYTCNVNIIRSKSRIRFDRSFCSRLCELKYRENKIRSVLPRSIPQLRKRIDKTLKYFVWRKIILGRDKSCVACGSSENLEIDHIKPLSRIIKEILDAKEYMSDDELFEALITSTEIFNKENGRVLCNSCHKKTDTYGFKLYHELTI